MELADTSLFRFLADKGAATAAPELAQHIARALPEPKSCCKLSQRDKR